MKNEQLETWVSEFGEDYISRNLPEHRVMASRITLWSKILNSLSCDSLTSILEVGSNVGLNLRALSLLSPAKLCAIEPFADALNICVSDGVIKKENAFCTSAFDRSIFKDSQIDLVFTSGVLIHIHPNDLKNATDNIVRMAKKYVVCVEYFSDKEESILYRGQKDRLFKRDFGSFYLDNYPELSLCDYGFMWKKVTGLDNLTWWLFEKK
ncbi:MAG: methyltransferase domain-containing protein [Alphaproteobacteria bacterium]|nr:methyltransferase domain-containing protein [Alphaproteobacteria bacterium]